MQELEIEFKNMIIKEEYDKLLAFFNASNEQIKTQTNIYFDTPTHELQQKECALRVRIKSDKIELTLKQPNTVGLLETTDLLSEEQLKELIDQNKLPVGAVYEQFKLLQVEPNIIHLASLTTYRFETTYHNQIIAIDQSEYYSNIDYEIELETQSVDEGKEIFHSLLDQFDIPIRKAENKIRRAFNYKQSKNIK
jgi:uncharacterized protein YjbK